MQEPFVNEYEVCCVVLACCAVCNTGILEVRLWITLLYCLVSVAARVCVGFYFSDYATTYQSVQFRLFARNTTRLMTDSTTVFFCFLSHNLPLPPHTQNAEWSLRDLCCTNQVCAMLIP